MLSRESCPVLAGGYTYTKHPITHWKELRELLRISENPYPHLNIQSNSLIFQAMCRREQEQTESSELQRLQEVFTAQQAELGEMQRRLAAFMTKGAHVVEAAVADDGARRTALQAAKARVGRRNAARSDRKK